MQVMSRKLPPGLPIPHVTIRIIIPFSYFLYGKSAEFVLSREGQRELVSWY